MLVLAATVSLNVILFIMVPKGFFPQQDTGRLTGAIQAEQSISFQLMKTKLLQFVKVVMADVAVTSMVAFTGGSGGTNTGRMYISLTDPDKRKITVDGIIARIRKISEHSGGCSFPPGGPGHPHRRPKQHAHTSSPSRVRIWRRSMIGRPK